MNKDQYTNFRDGTKEKKLKALVDSTVDSKTNPNATLQYIIDDCLRVICKYLDVVDLAKLGLTCRRLYGFVSECTRVKNFKHTEIEMNYYNHYNEHQYCADTESLASDMRYFGAYVKELTWRGCSAFMQVKTDEMNTFYQILGMFPNIDTMRLLEIKFDNDEALRNVTQNLRKLELHCEGIADQGIFAMCHLNKITELNLHGATNSCVNDFYDRFKSLSRLTLNHSYRVNVEPKFVKELFECNARYMKDLCLNFDDIIYSESIGTLLGKLLKLETLEVDFITDSLINSLPELKHLKFLKINCRIMHQCNSLLHTLSACGIIERLEITGGFLAKEVITLPLIFKNLKTLHFDWRSETPTFLKPLTESEMPALISLRINFRVFEICEKDVGTLMDFIRSKETLKYFYPNYSIIYNEFDFIRRLIDVLVETPSRPILQLAYNDTQFNAKTVRNINYQKFTESNQL